MRIPEQGRYLRLVLNGFYNYYAVPTNCRALNAFYYHVFWLPITTCSGCAACSGDASGTG